MMAFEAILWRNEGVASAAAAQAAFVAAERSRPTVPQRAQIHMIAELRSALAESGSGAASFPALAETRGPYVWVQTPWDLLPRIGHRLLSVAEGAGYTIYAPIGVLVPPGGDAPDWLRIAETAHAQAEAAFSMGHAVPDRAHSEALSRPALTKSQSETALVSFDLCVWKSDRRLTETQAQSVFEQLARGLMDPPVEPAVEEFVSLLNERTAGLHGIEVTQRPGFVILNVPWDRADEIGVAAQELALDLELTLFDPQNGVLVQPIGPGMA